MADLRAAETGDGYDLRIGGAGDVVDPVGVVGEKNPVRLSGVRNEADVRGQLPFAQAVKIGICCAAVSVLVNSYGTIPPGQGTVAGEMPA